VNGARSQPGRAEPIAEQHAAATMDRQMRGPVSAPAAIMTSLLSSRMFQSAALKAAPVFGLVPRVGNQLKMGEVSEPDPSERRAGHPRAKAGP